LIAYYKRNVFESRIERISLTSSRWAQRWWHRSPWRAAVVSVAETSLRDAPQSPPYQSISERRNEWSLLHGAYRDALLFMFNHLTFGKPITIIIYY